MSAHLPESSPDLGQIQESLDADNQELPAGAEVSGVSQCEAVTSRSEFIDRCIRYVLEELSSYYPSNSVHRSDLEVFVGKPHYTRPAPGDGRSRRVNPLALIRLPDGLTGSQWDAEAASICGVTPRAVADWRRGLVKDGFLERRRVGKSFTFHRTEKGQEAASKPYETFVLSLALRAETGSRAKPDFDPDADLGKFRRMVAWKCRSQIGGIPELALVESLHGSTRWSKAKIYGGLRRMQMDGDLVVWHLGPPGANERGFCPACGLVAERCSCHEPENLTRHITITPNLYPLLGLRLPSGLADDRSTTTESPSVGHSAYPR